MEHEVFSYNNSVRDKKVGGNVRRANSTLSLTFILLQIKVQKTTFRSWLTTGSLYVTWSVASLSYTNTVTTNPFALISPPINCHGSQKSCFHKCLLFSALPVSEVLPKNERNSVQDWLFWALHTLIFPLILFCFVLHPFKYVYHLPLELLFAV